MPKKNAEQQVKEPKVKETKAPKAPKEKIKKEKVKKELSPTARIVVDTLKLFVITLVAALALGAVNDLTFEKREANKAAKAQGAFAEVFPAAAKFVASSEETKLQGLISNATAKLEEGGISGVTIADANIAKSSSGDVLGYVVSATVKGYDVFTLVIGYSVDGKITGFSFVEMNETPGFGKNADTPEYKAQFKDIEATSIVVKKGASASNEVEAVSGATMTSNAIQKGVNGAIYFTQVSLFPEFGGNGDALAMQQAAAEAAAKAKREAYQSAFPSAASFEDKETNSNLAAALANAEKVLAAEYSRVEITDVQIAKDASGKVLGYVIASKTQGFEGDEYSDGYEPFTLLVGLTDKGEIQGISFLEINAGEGFGNANTPEFKSQFVGKVVTSENRIKKTNSGASAPNEFDAISGATYTSTGVARAINAAVVFAESEVFDRIADPEGFISKKALPEAAVYVTVEEDAELADALSRYAEILTDYADVTVNNVVMGLDAEGNIAGAAVTVSLKGFAGDIKLVVGILTDGTVCGFEYLEIASDEGFGEASSDSFVAQIIGKKTTQDARLKVAMSGASADNEIDSISGATTSSRTIAKAVNAAAIFAENSVFNRIGGAVNE